MPKINFPDFVVEGKVTPENTAKAKSLVENPSNMLDIVERLRRPPHGRLFDEAADVIEQLRNGLLMIVAQEYDAGYSPESYAEAVLSGHEPEPQSWKTGKVVDPETREPSPPPTHTIRETPWPF